MRLQRLRANGKLFLVDRSKLVAASPYFAAYLDGPLAASENADESVDLLEQDIDRLTQLFYFIQHGRLSAAVLNDQLLYNKLDTIAGFYLVTLPPFRQPTRVHAYKQVSLFTWPIATSAAQLSEFKSLLSDLREKTLTTTLSYDSGPVLSLIKQLAASGHCDTFHFEFMPCAETARTAYCVFLFSCVGVEEMAELYPGFLEHFAVM